MIVASSLTCQEAMGCEFRRGDKKLNYLHTHPVKRGLVKRAGDWPGSSGRFYFWNDASILAMDKTL
jgi:hypothetical protein